MNKGDLVAAVSEITNLTKAQTGAVVDAMLDVIAAELKKGDEVRLVGFGTFTTARREAGTARNPRTGDMVKIEAGFKPIFEASKELKAVLNSRSSKSKS